MWTCRPTPPHRDMQLPVAFMQPPFPTQGLFSCSEPELLANAPPTDAHPSRPLQRTRPTSGPLPSQSPSCHQRAEEQKPQLPVPSPSLRLLLIKRHSSVQYYYTIIILFAASCQHVTDATVAQDPLDIRVNASRFPSSIQRSIFCPSLFSTSLSPSLSPSLSLCISSFSFSPSHCFHPFCIVKHI